MEKVLDARTGQAFVQRATDPLLGGAYSSPADFAGQYPVPLDVTEFIAMAEEVSLLQAIPEKTTALKEYTWREMTSLAFVSGTSSAVFADGDCPEEYTHDGTPITVTLKNIGAKKSLSESDIMQSAAVAAANWNGINRLVGGGSASEGLPGGSGATLLQKAVADLKAKEITTATVLTLNSTDRLLAVGDATTNSLEFDGIENIVTTANGSNVDTTSISGSFAAADFDKFLAGASVRPTAVYGHPQAVQEMLSGYFQLGFNGSQVISYQDGAQLTPGFNFASFVLTSVGRLRVVSDINFSTIDVGGGAFQSSLFAMREKSNGEDLVYRLSQFPVSFKDLTPGCTSISFEVWTKTALIVKFRAAQNRYYAQFSGNVTATVPIIGA